jgi:hypothetical protein
MAITDSQKVDLLWKKVGFSKMKTDTNAQKKAPNEAIVSDFIIKTAQIWTNSSSIPGTIPASSSSIVTVYSDSVGNTLETTEDGTAADNRTWKTGITNWIPPSFGATYQLKVYAAASGQANPQTNGTQLFETGSGNDDQWYFDYQSGVLHFIGTNLPTDIGTGTANVIFVAGAKYAGSLGIGADATGASATFRKSNLAAVYADTSINEGDIIEVSDGGDGEYAVYIAKQDNPGSTGQLTLISTRDSSGTDSATLSATIAHNSSATTALGNVSATSKAVNVMVEVTQAFDGSASLTVGDSGDNDRLMGSNYVDLQTAGTYMTNPSYVYTNATDANNTLNVYYSHGSATIGSAKVTIQYT